MIPPLVDISGAPFRFLPPGTHLGSIAEIRERFAFNEHRRHLFSGFEAVVVELSSAGCRRIYLDGGFVSDSPHPKDFDGCWDPVGVDFSKVDPVLLDYSRDRAAQKQKYFGEMFISITPEVSGKTFLEFFQTERNTGAKKGIVLIESKV